MKKKVSVLIPDGESNLVINVLRCLSDVRGLKIYILSSEEYLPIRYSRYVSRFIYENTSADPLAHIGRINELVEQYSIDVILPVHALAIRRLIAFRHLLLHPEKTLIPPSTEIFDLADDKIKLANQLLTLGIPYPGSWPLYDKDGALNDLNSFTYPLLLKPSVGIGGGAGILRFNDKKELSAYLDSNTPLEDVFLQEYVEGTDLGFNVLCKNGEILAYTIQLGTLFHDDPYKPQIGLKMIREESILQAMRKLMRSLNWSGVAHIDMVFNPGNRDFKVLEINPRFWLTLQGSCLAGVNFPWLYCQTVREKKIQQPEYSKIQFLTLQGLAKLIRKNPSFLFKFKFIWSQTPFKYWLKEPGIFLFVMRRHLKSPLIGIL
jgi:predicted ATP-grasp superfamily ATP-dependent carboligase